MNGYIQRFGRAYISSAIASYIVLSASPAIAQSNGRLEVDEQSYRLWHYLNPPTVSTDGAFVSYSVSYETGEDTLFVSSGKGKIRYRIAGSRDGSFIAGKWFSTLARNKELVVKSLEGKMGYTLKNVTSVLYDANRAIVIYEQQRGSLQLLCWLSLPDGKSSELGTAGTYKYNADSGLLAYCKHEGPQYALHLFDMVTKKDSILLSGKAQYQLLDWDNKGEKLAFAGEEYNGETLVGATLGLYDISQKQLALFRPEPYRAFGEILSPGLSGVSDLELSGDGRRIFWKAPINSVPVATANPIVQVWHSDDKRIYPVKQYGPEPLDGKLLVMWEPGTGTFLTLTDTAYPEGSFDLRRNHFISSSSVPYEPHSRFHPCKDYRVTDLATGRQQIVLEAYAADIGTVSFSATGRYISYFKEGNWWVFDNEEKIHKCLTNLLPTDFKKIGDMPNATAPFAFPVWSKDDVAVFVYDEFDIWMIDPVSLQAKRLTHGKEAGIRYRFAPQLNGNSSKQRKEGIDLNRHLVLHAMGHTLSGYVLLDKSYKIIPLVMKDSKFGDAILADNGLLFYIEQAFSRPPALMALKAGWQRPVLLFQSNSHHNKYAWGKAELIQFYNTKGQPLKATLYYPPGYQRGKRYPMVVHIYDKQTSKRNNYINPSLYNENGFNIANLTSKGYLVLLPDISYEGGNPGRSATDCVLAAVRKAIEMGAADKDKVGLIGHSFGGYETDYIITQTDLFAAAVSGAAITDLVSSYLYVSTKYGLPNFFHYEFGQLRMGGSLFSNYLGYVDNSPIYHAGHIKSPLLSWCGEDDSQVDPSQSFEFYLALRRLGKEHSLLVFPGQQHVLTDNAKQELLTRSIEGWFGHYLRGEPKPQWLSE